MKLVFATNNQHKLAELRKILSKDIELLSLKDLDCFDEIPEDHATLEENASQKAFYIYNKYGVSCFADDTGLEIEALDNKPGVYSARYAGVDKDAEANMQKVLKELEKINNRSARFRTVISLVIDGKEKQFEGIVEGRMLTEKNGEKGFGYDPIFQPNGYNCSFAQMGMDEKNKISHRGRAVRKLVEYLNQLTEA